MLTAQMTTAPDLQPGLQTTLADVNALAEAALLIHGAETDEEIGAALRHTFHTWSTLRAELAWRQDWPPALAGRFEELADYVLATVLSAERGAMTVQKLSTLATINLQIAMGILEEQVAAVLGPEAFERWVADGRPMGADLEAWVSAQSA